MSKELFTSERETRLIAETRADHEHQIKLGDDRADYQQLEHEQRQPRTKDVVRINDNRH
jgi:hypothetical protein